MPVPVERRVVALGLIALSLTLYAMVSTDRNHRHETGLPEPSPLTDTLIAVYGQILGAAAANDASQLTNLFDRNMVHSIGLPAARKGNKIVDAYLLHRIRTWPDLNNLSMIEVRNDADYVRLTMVAPSNDRIDHVRYTFVLFRTVDSRWRFSGLTNLELGSSDRYGHPISYHETDLPPAMRFPRRF